MSQLEKSDEQLLTEKRALGSLISLARGHPQFFHLYKMEKDYEEITNEIQRRIDNRI